MKSGSIFLAALILTWIAAAAAIQPAANEAVSGEQPRTTVITGEQVGTGDGRPNLPGSIFGHRERVLREGGGTNASGAAIARGLKWLLRVQLPDGRWKLDHPAFKEKGVENDVAATALALLPLLAVNKTHKPAKDNPYDRDVAKGLAFLLHAQNRQTGFFGDPNPAHSAYGHGLATIAVCEAFALTKDPDLREPAQLAINYILAAQHEQGGWRYEAKQPGDLSVSGWMITALMTAKIAGIEVPADTLRKVRSFLDSCSNTSDEGYGYTPGMTSSTATMTAVGLLCRQYLQNWAPQNIHMIKAVDSVLKKTPPNVGNCYYRYYATQVMHHNGGKAWQEWNELCRNHLVMTQDRNQESPNWGSWDPAGDVWEKTGGRLLITVLNILTLEVYYRHLPHYFREQPVQDSRREPRGR